MASPDYFSLRWNSFHETITSGFQALLVEDDLADVTLAADGHYVHAHKLILSICSPYFKELFKSNPCRHPIVILNGVTYSELREIMRFMYNGEVNIRSQDLEKFLQTADMLQVKGLSTEKTPDREPSPHSLPDGDDDSVFSTSINNNYNSQNDSTSVEDHPLNDVEVKSPLKKLLSNSNRNDSPPKSKSEKIQKNSTNNNSNSMEVINCISDGEQLYESELDDIAEPEEFPAVSNQEQDLNCKGRGIKCQLCHRFFVNRYNLKVHVRDKHDTKEGTLQCEICQKRMRNPSCLRVHMYHHRKQAASQTSILEQQSLLSTMSDNIKIDDLM